MIHVFKENFKPGDLVARRYPWGITSHEVGIVIHSTSDENENLLILWSQQDSCKISGCHISNLLIIDERSSLHLGVRCQTTS